MIDAAGGARPGCTLPRLPRCWRQTSPKPLRLPYNSNTRPARRRLHALPPPLPTYRSAPMPSTSLVTLAQLGLPDHAHHIHALYSLVPDTPGPTDAAYTDLIGILGSDAIPISQLRRCDL